MADEGKTREEILRLTQMLIVEGTKIVGAFAARHGLHQSDVEALNRVMIAQDRGEPLAAGALARDLGLTSGAITFLIDRLERAGHVNRVRDDTDRRKVLLHYSPGGRALADEFFTPMGRNSHAAMDQFSPKELEIVRRFLAVTSSTLADHRQSLKPWETDDEVLGRRPGGPGAL